MKNTETLEQMVNLESLAKRIKMRNFSDKEVTHYFLTLYEVYDVESINKLMIIFNSK